MDLLLRAVEARIAAYHLSVPRAWYRRLHLHSLAVLPSSGEVRLEAAEGVSAASGYRSLAPVMGVVVGDFAVLARVVAVSRLMRDLSSRSEAVTVVLLGLTQVHSYQMLLS